MTIPMQIKIRTTEKPPSYLPRPAHPWRVAVLANIKEHDKPLPPDVPPDAGADYDYIETIDLSGQPLKLMAIRRSSSRADANLPALLRKSSQISASISPKV